MRAVAIVAIVLALGASLASAEMPYGPVSAAAALAAEDTDALELALSRVSIAATEHPDDFQAQLEAAELLLSFADRLRNERKIRSDLPGERDAEYRAQQAEWAEKALPRAERALELAGDDAELAQAERVVGELYAHRITGMVSGMINGPRARRHIGHALELAPDDPECNRAIGLMYLHNPPISGGDVDKAVTTFERCGEELPDGRCLVLLSMAHRKRGDLEAARQAARAALEREPYNVEAEWLLSELN